MIDPDTIVDGRYRVISRIGTGGMADVYLAEDQLLGRQVALKLLHQRFAEDQEFVERFRREASSAAGLSHPNVVAVFDRGQWNGTYYIAMEYLPGRSLKTIVREHGPLDPVEAIDIVVQILRAARFAHRRGVIHRDLKPHNVILDEEGRAKVTDFGIARAGASDMTITGSIMGTAQYLSPEQAQGQAVSQTSDIYAIGIVLYELLTASIPFDGETAVSIALQQVSTAPPPPSARNPAVTPQLDAVVLRALAKDPTMRYTDADEFIAALQQVRAELTSPARARQTTSNPLLPPPPVAMPALVGAARTPPRRRSRRRRMLWVVLAVLLIAAAIAAVAILRSPKVVVPDVVNKMQVYVEADFQELDLKPRFSEVASASFKRGHVVQTRPAAGTSVAKGSTVDVLISRGSKKIAVPDVAALRQAEAEKQLHGVGLKPVSEYRYSAKFNAGTVISTEPATGTHVPVRSTVHVLVSQGPRPVAVPEVVGRSLAAAEADITGAGLKVGRVTPLQATGKTAGQVISQLPQSTETLPEGGAVSLVVAAASKEVAVPDVVGDNETEAATILADAHFEVHRKVRIVTEPSESETVLHQKPKAGRMVKHGSTVTITVGRLERSTEVTTTVPTTTTPVPTTTTPVPTTTTPVPTTTPPTE